MTQPEQIIQRSPEWFAFRLGKVSASRVADVMAKTKSGPAASRTNYMMQLLCERLTGLLARTGALKLRCSTHHPTLNLSAVASRSQSITSRCRRKWPAPGARGATS